MIQHEGVLHNVSSVKPFQCVSPLSHCFTHSSSPAAQREIQRCCSVLGVIVEEKSTQQYSVEFVCK